MTNEKTRKIMSSIFGKTRKISLLLRIVRREFVYEIYGRKESLFI